MGETLATITASLALINGLMQVVRLFGLLFTRLRWGTNVYDVVDSLFELAKDTNLRKVIIRCGGKDILDEMDLCKADAKKAAKQIDFTAREARKILYETRIIMQERKERALLEKQRARESS